MNNKWVLSVVFNQYDMEYVNNDIKLFSISDLVKDLGFTLWTFENKLFISGEKVASYEISEDGKISILDIWDTMVEPIEVSLKRAYN